MSVWPSWALSRAIRGELVAGCRAASAACSAAILEGEDTDDPGAPCMLAYDPRLFRELGLACARPPAGGGARCGPVLRARQRSAVRSRGYEGFGGGRAPARPTTGGGAPVLLPPPEHRLVGCERMAL